MGCIVGCIRWALIQTNVTKVWLWPQSQLYASAQSLFLLPPASCPGSLWPQQGEFSNSKEANPPLHSTDQPKWPETLLKMTQSHQQSSHCFFSDYQGCGTERCVNRDPDIYRHTGTCPRPARLEFGSHAAAWLAGFVGFDKRPNSSGISTWLTHFVCWCVWGGRFLHSSTDSQEQELAKECSINRNWHVQMGPGCNWAGRWG